MRRPDPAELEVAILALLALVPVGYYTVRFLMGCLDNACCGDHCRGSYG